MKIYVGIDIHRNFHEVAIIPQTMMANNGYHHLDTLKITTCRQDFEKIVTEINRLSDCPQVTVGIDHTGGHYSAPLLHYLYQQGYTIFYLEPKGFKTLKKNLLGVDNKTDALDAISMARLLWLKETTGDNYRFSTTQPDLTTLSSVLHPLVQQRWAMNKYKTQATNRLHHLLTSTFPEGEKQYFTYLLKIVHFYPTPERIIEAGEDNLVKAGLSKAKASQILEAAKDTIGIPAERYEDIIKIMALQRLDAEIKVNDLTDHIIELVKDHPYTRILFSFPGVNYIAAGTLIAAIGNIDNWRTKHAFRKGMGIYPVLAQSGKRRGQSVLGQEGSKDARRVLYQVIFTSITDRAPDSDFKDYFHKCKARGMRGKNAILASAGLFCEILYHCLKNNEPYEYKKGRR